MTGEPQSSEQIAITWDKEPHPPSVGWRMRPASHFRRTVPSRAIGWGISCLGPRWLNHAQWFNTALNMTDIYSTQAPEARPVVSMPLDPRSLAHPAVKKEFDLRAGLRDKVRS